MIASLALLAVLSFAIGSIPWGPILARIAGGPDLRSRGSGNPGATNVMRVLGPGWGIATLILDIGKGWLCAGPLVRWLAPSTGLESLSSLQATAPDVKFEAPILIAASCGVLGHLFSPWLRFRGGKGVATAVGCYLAIAPLPAIISIAIFGCALAAWRFVSLGSLAMAASFPVGVWLTGPRGMTALWGVLLAFLIAWRHRSNVSRLLKRTEPRIGRRA